MYLHQICQQKLFSQVRPSFLLIQQASLKKIKFYLTLSMRSKANEMLNYKNLWNIKLGKRPIKYRRKNCLNILSHATGFTTYFVQLVRSRKRCWRTNFGAIGTKENIGSLLTKDRFNLRKDLISTTAGFIRSNTLAIVTVDLTAIVKLT